jgi:ABC-type uncharacterized transport system substrate-binding protein
VLQRLPELALQSRLPGIVSLQSLVKLGMLMSYSPNIPGMYRRAGAIVDMILKGAKPADPPVQQPTTFDLVVNANTLHALGLTIPPSVLPLVTEWTQ